MFYQELEMEKFYKENLKKLGGGGGTLWKPEGSAHIAFQNIHRASDQVISRGFCGGCKGSKLLDQRVKSQEWEILVLPPVHFRKGLPNFTVRGWNA